MKILVLTRNAWDDTNSIGNTISNFFSDFKGAEFANIYFRSSRPDNNLCDKYFRVTEKDILKNFFSKEKIGERIIGFPTKDQRVKARSNEKKLISAIHKYNLKFFYTISNGLFNSKKWINRKLDDFIKEFDPDVVFSFAKSAPQYYLTLEHIHKKFGKKIVLWIADDEYTALKSANTKDSLRSVERLKYIIGAASKVYGCSKEICSYYNGIFNCNAVPLYKSCRFVQPVRTAVNTPIRIVYAGNLLFGRFKTLCDIVNKLSDLNLSENKFFLEIYSNTLISEEQKRKLTVDGVSVFCGQRPYEEIKNIFSSSDILLLVESFEKSEIVKTKYSFSTKIIDCLQSGSSVLAIGPKEISTIKYVSSIPGAAVVNDINGFENFAREIADNPESLLTCAAQIRKFAIEHHSPDYDWLNI